MKHDPRWKFFKCQRCGRCCREIGLPYDAESAIRIAESLSVSLTELIERYYGEFVRNGQFWRSQDEKRTPCPFLIKDGGKCSCRIYPIRPYGCKMYPLETDFGCQGVDCPALRIANDEFDKKAASPDAQGDER